MIVELQLNDILMTWLFNRNLSFISASISQIVIISNVGGRVNYATIYYLR